MNFTKFLHPRGSNFAATSNSAPDGTLLDHKPDGEVWMGYAEECDEHQNDTIRNYLGIFASDYNDDDMQVMGDTYRLRIEARAEAEGERNSDGELVLPARWLADMPEEHWLHDINTTIQNFDEQRAATADSLSDLMKLNHDDRAWLTAALANGGSVRTQVCVETAAIDEESMFGDREVIGNRP